MSSNEGLNAPRNLGGVLARIGVWTGDNWEPPPPGAVSFGEIMGARPATDTILARNGVPSGCPADGIIIEAGESDEK